MQEVIPRILRLKMPPIGPAAWEVSNVYFVGEGEVFIVDAGYPTDDSRSSIIGAWEELDKPAVRAVLITHTHPDHAGALREIVDTTGAPVWMHEYEAPYVEPYYPPDAIDRFLEDGDEIEAGGVRLRVLYIPGHTTGHLCFLDIDRNALFTGDHIVGSGYAVIVPPQGDMILYMAGLIRMKEMAPDRLIPGHGPPVRDASAKIREYIDHRILREIQILRQLEHGPRSIDDMAGEIYHDLHPVLRNAGRYQILAHLAKMESEGLVENENGYGVDTEWRSTVGKLPF